MSEPREVRAIPVRGIPEIDRHSKISKELVSACARQDTPLEAGDILIVTHKIISKAEGQVVRLDGVKPSRRSRGWARRYPVDARVIELALRQARRVVRMRNGVLITETKQGLVCANSGVDLSNVDGGDSAVLLPKDPDRSAARSAQARKRQRQP